MLVQDFSQVTRANKTISTQSDLVVVGGGLAGVCCAIAGTVMVTASAPKTAAGRIRSFNFIFYPP